MGFVEQAAGASRLVPEGERMGIMPKYIGNSRWLMLLDSMIFAQLKSMCGAYEGGYWEMVETGTGAFFMWPRMRAQDHGGMLMLRAENGSECLVSPEAAGVVASLYAFNRLCWSTREEQHILLFQNLMDYARTHPEWVHIQALVD